jgi:uncharacterized protein YjbI with pentapeptide repeats
MQTRKNKTRYARETGETLPRSIARLRSYVGKPGYFIHFSNYNKLGLNPTNKYDTPTGFYAYISGSEGGISGFANDRPFAVVFKTAPLARILTIGSYRPKSLDKDKAKVAAWLISKKGELAFSVDVLHSFYDANKLHEFGIIKKATVGRKGTKVAITAESIEGVVGIAAETARDTGLAASKIWNITRVIAASIVSKRAKVPSGKRQTTATWSGVMYKVLGYDGVVDNHYSVIHPNEPSQAVFFDTSQYGTAESKPKLELVEVIESHAENGFKMWRVTKERARVADVKPRREYSNLSFVGLDLSGADLREAKFKDCDFTRAKMVGANVSGAAFDRCKMRYTDLSQASAKDAGFYWCDIVDAKMVDMFARDAAFDRCVFNDSDMRRADFSGSSMSYTKGLMVDLTGATMNGVATKGLLLSGDLRGVDFRDAFLNGANLSDSNLSGASFAGASVVNAQMYRCNVDGVDPADLKGAIGLDVPYDD